MNIRDAKEEIKNAMQAYMTKNKFGQYRIPVERQRPIFLMGPPGIGKTAIMEQIAEELGVALVSYSMTHHTRQSALGLPYIEKKVYNGKEYAVSEYTMSEIIASVYDMMAETGKKEGILFLDEINCVSETLSPSMLQFLQYKVFGRHRVPDGWIVVTAGNPPEFNNSVREFDIVTWDRMKRIDVEPDYEAWKEYAYKKGAHPAITTYLDIRKSDFYKIETTVEGRSFVTARGWSDLSDMIRLYEENELPIRESLVAQYIQNKKIAKEFAVYYDLFNKYKSDYQIDKILDGKANEKIIQRAAAAEFDERITLIGLLLDGVMGEITEVCGQEEAIKRLTKIIASVKPELGRPNGGAAKAFFRQEELIGAELETGRKTGTMSQETMFITAELIEILHALGELLEEKAPKSAADAFKLIKTDYDKRSKELTKLAASVGKKLDNLFRFAEAAFQEGQELLILVTEITINYYASHFVSRYGCEAYFEHNDEMLFYERQKSIISDLGDLGDLGDLEGLD